MKRGILLILFLLLCLSAYANDDNSPLYIGRGWKITSGRSGDWVLNAGYAEPVLYSKAFMWFANRGASDYYFFPVLLNKGVVITWRPTSSIILTYEADGDTLTASSGEYIFFNRALTDVVHGYDVRYTALSKYFISVSGKRSRVFATPKSQDGKPIVIARFDFNEKYPERLISWKPLNVLERGGR